MSIRVRYFASLREKMGRVEENLPAEGMSTIADVWKAVSGGLPLPDRILCAVNMDYATLDATVRDGDEVAFFPPVTGG
jgi:molybdopterin synthase sulfur carrier subunit